MKIMTRYTKRLTSEMGLRLTLDDITARHSRHYGSSLTSLRLVVTLLLMMFVGVGEMWGQQMTDFEGVWYIASNGNAYKAGTTTNLPYTYDSDSPEANFYLRPAADPQIADETDAFFDGTAETKPFLTTNYTGHTDIALWILKKTNISYTISSVVYYYYTIQHAETGKYVVCDPFFSGTLGDNNDSRRKSMHLETKDWTTTIPNKALFKIRYTADESTAEDNSDSYCFIPKLVENKSRKYWNIADRNQPVNYGTKSDKYYGGLVGLYTFGTTPANVVDINSRFKFEPYEVAKPTITFNNATNEVTITSSVTGAKIYYTTNGDTPTSELTAHTSPVTFTQTTPCTIKAIAVKSWSSGVKVSSNEATYNLPKVATPTITINSDNSVTITCSTADATIYYKLGGDAPTIADGIQSSTIASILSSQGPIKAIAAKDGWINSDIATEATIPAKTINSPIIIVTGTYTYNGEEQEPSVTVMDGETVIDETEYTASYGNNINAGTNTATITITDNIGGDYNVSGSSTFSIAQRPVTVTGGITAEDKIYDGTTNANLDCTGAEFVGKIENDDLTILSATGDFADKNVGTGKTVTITGLTFGGTAKDNYTLAESGNQSSITASISAKDVTASGTISASNKVYDGTTTAVFDYSGVTLTGKVDGDDLSYTATGAFADKNVGTGKSITISSEGLSGEDAGNYSLTSSSVSASTTANISAAEITISGITAENKVYNSTTTATLVYSGVTFTGMVEGDVLSVTATGAFADANIGTGKTVNISGLTLGGADAGNYTLAESGQQTETTAAITAKAVTITAKNGEKEFDGTPLTQPDFTATALEAGDTHTFTVTMTAGSTITNVGSTPNVIATVDGVAVTTGTETAVGNYLVTTVNGTLTIIGSNNIHITLTMNGWTYGNSPTNPNLTIAEYSANNATKTFYYKVKDAADNTYTTTKPTNTSKAATYTVKVVVEPYESYNGGEATTDFTIAQAKLTITAQAKSKDYLDEDPVLTYTVSGLKNKEYQEDVLKVCNLQRESGEDVKDGGYAISINETNFTISSNYYRDFVSNVLTINPKNLGDGETSAPGIGVYAKKDGDAWDVSLYNGKNKFDSTNDYDPPVITGPDDGGNYTITITGKGNNCVGTAKATYSDVTTFYSIDGTTEKFMPYISTTSDLMTSADLVPYIVAQINPTIGTISIAPINYIPEGVPVLLLAPSDVTGITTSPKNPATPAISESLINSNQLQMAPDEPSDPDDPESVHGVHVEDTEAYVFYQGEFVLTTEGTIKAGKYYLYNPNYRAAASPSIPANPAPMRSLSIVKGETTGIIQLINDETTERGNDVWYTIDGQRLTTKPTRKGFYIKNGKKIIVK